MFSGVASAAYTLPFCDVSADLSPIESQVCRIQSHLLSISEKLLHIEVRLNQVSGQHKDQILQAINDQKMQFEVIQTHALEIADKNDQDTQELVLRSANKNEQFMSLLIGLELFMFVTLCILMLWHVWFSKRFFLTQATTYPLGRVQTPASTSGLVDLDREVPINELSDGFAESGVPPQDEMPESTAMNTLDDSSIESALTSDSVRAFEAPMLDTTIGIDKAEYMEQLARTFAADQRTFMQQDFFQNRKSTSRLFKR